MGSYAVHEDFRSPSVSNISPPRITQLTHSSLRRGFQVYREVCSACHSLSRIPYRSLVGVTHTVDEAKAMAEENEYDSEPNDEGEIEKRPGGVFWNLSQLRFPRLRCGPGRRFVSIWGFEEFRIGGGRGV